LAALVFCRDKFVSLVDMDLSEIYLIEQERAEEKQMMAMLATVPQSWWRRWLI
jgi:hypothetical protein